MMRECTIGKLAEMTGSNVETIRYYERINLLPKPSRSSGGHRLYGNETVQRLAFICQSRKLGFSLDEVRGLLRYVDDGNYTCAEIRSIAIGHLEEVRRKLADLKRLERALKNMIAECEGGEVPGCPILDALYN